jgi:uncharacterized protein YebE (UPF0316 family)
VVLPLLIFCARLFDQSMGIMRIIMATKGFTLPAFFFGFFESFVWLLAIGQIMSRVNNFYYYFVFAFGFACGNVCGIFIEKKLSIGFVVIRVIFVKDAEESIKELRDNGFCLTVVDAMGMKQPVKLVYSAIHRNQTEKFLDILKTNNPNAFFTIEDVKQVKEGYFSGSRRSLNPFNR